MSKADTIHIVLASDDAYVQHLGVLLVSIFENNREETMLIHLMTDNISDKNKRLLSQIVDLQYGQRLIFYEMDKTLFKEFPLRTRDHISIAAYYRLMLVELLPEEISRILYLDCDMIVTGLLRPLWDVDMNGKAVAAVMDNLFFTPETFSRLSLPVGDGYFNSGTLLINLDYWRKVDVFGKALRITETKSDILLWHDQDILNLLFHKCWLRLPYRWNVMNTLMRPFPYYTPELLKEIDKEIEERVIIHYTCAWKPWIYPCDNPLCFEYYKYLRLSPWRSFKPKASIWKRAKWRIHTIRISLGLLKNGYRNLEL
ncbi:glycosyltransferase family 8 protein [Bacteroides cutis]|jgi:lipopolysaccharide biosynthesis glycosyltransferase|uniref:glycosyltransferase family 8 protein n=1 Tax=Bacteroides cutis TaxID=2024197 RepID=UPI0023A8BBB4|nr:glycosyltransferase family 8 protein [Bacteroides cutis]